MKWFLKSCEIHSTRCEKPCKMSHLFMKVLLLLNNFIFCYRNALLFILLRGEQKYSCICDIKAICIAFYYTKSIYPDGEHIQTRLRYTTQIFLCWERIKGPHIIVIYISHTQQDKCLDKVLYGRIQFFISHFENEIVVPLYTFFANKY